ncbi:MAG: polysaccharide export protein [Hyphomicrobiales bacterium]|nr:polysaccharide export protein [Hyphomicrobiales bacterium]
MLKISSICWAQTTRWLILGVFLLGLVSTVNLSARASEVETGYRLGAGDRIRVTVFGHEDLSGEFDVDGNGNVSLPLLREVSAQGKSTSELEATIADKLSPDYLVNPRVSVDLLTYRPFYIYGEVNNPGSYPYENGMTVRKAVATAGGYTYRARESKARITRSSSSKGEETFDLDDGPVSIYPGDVIKIPERYF